MTPLPEPAMPPAGIYDNDGLFSKAQLKAYGAAEYARAIEDAARVCDDLNKYEGHSSKRPTPGQCGWAVRQLGAAS